MICYAGARVRDGAVWYVLGGVCFPSSPEAPSWQFPILLKKGCDMEQVWR